MSISNQVTEKLISRKHCHGHLISTPQVVKFCQAKNRHGKFHTYSEVAWYEETTSVIFRKKVFSVRKYGVLEAFKLAMDFRNMLIEVKEERMKLFVARVKKDMNLKQGVM
jgi:hypothetical protein